MAAPVPALGLLAKGREMVKHAQLLLESALPLLTNDAKGKDAAFKALQTLYKHFQKEPKGGEEIFRMMQRAMQQGPNKAPGPGPGMPGPGMPGAQGPGGGAGTMPTPPTGPIPQMRPQ